LETSSKSEVILQYSHILLNTFHQYRVSGHVLIVLALLLFNFEPVNAQNEIDEREQIVWKVTFEGNENYSRMVLRDIIATDQPSIINKILGRTSDYDLRENEIRRDVIRIRRYYERRGFDQVNVSYRVEDRRRQWRKEVVFEIDEGEPLRIRDVSIVFDTSEDNEEVIRSSRDFDRALRRHDYQPGNRYQRARSSDVEGLFVRAMEESGFAYAEVDIEADIDSLSRSVSLVIENRSGPRKTFSSFDIEGELSVDKRIVERETGIRQGEIYSRSKMQNAQRQLFNHHLFRFATIGIPDEPTDSTLEVSVRIREYPQRSIQTTIGFGREELLRGQLSWQHRNVNQWAHRFSTTGRASFLEQRFGVDYLIPYVFNTHSSFVSSPYIQRREEQAFTIFRFGFSNSLIYQYSPNLTGSVSYELTFTEEQSGVPESALPDTILSYNTGSFVVSGYYGSGLSRNEEGWVVQPSVEFSNVFNEGTYNFQKVTLDIRRYTPLSNTLMFAKRIQGGAIFTTEDAGLPSNIRFFSGGTNSIRGWSRQTLGPKVAVMEDGEFHSYVPIGGRKHVNFNLEFRQSLHSLIRGFGIAAFLDGGQVWRSLNDLDERPVQFGAGGGIRYDSPIGPLRVDIGYKLNPSDEDLNRFNGVDYGGSMSRIGIHFSIGQAF
jgi:outer membrane protein insertion porin family